MAVPQLSERAGLVMDAVLKAQTDLSAKLRPSTMAMSKLVTAASEVRSSGQSESLQQMSLTRSLAIVL